MAKELTALGFYLETARASKQMTQKEFAQYLDMTLAWYQKIIKTENVNDNRVLSISQRLGVNLLGKSDEELRNMARTKVNSSTRISLHFLSKYTKESKNSEYYIDINIPIFHDDNQYIGLVVDIINYLSLGFDLNDILLIDKKSVKNTLLINDKDDKIKLINKRDFKPTEHEFIGSVARILKTLD